MFDEKWMKTQEYKSETLEYKNKREPILSLDLNF